MEPAPPLRSARTARTTTARPSCISPRNRGPPSTRNGRIDLLRRAFHPTLFALVTLLALLVPIHAAEAVTTGNGSLVYSPSAGSSFDPAGTTYSKIISLKNNGSSNGQLLVTFDQLVYVNGVQVYPIYRSTDGGSSWTHVTDVVPSSTF